MNKPLTGLFYLLDTVISSPQLTELS